MDNKEDLQELRRLVAILMPGWAVPDITEFHFLSGGYSNRNYRFSYRDAAYVLRVPGRKPEHVDRMIEEQIYQAPGTAAVPALAAFDVNTGAMISCWQDGDVLADTTVDAHSLIGYLRRLHRDLPAVERTYDPVAIAREQLSVGHVSAGQAPAAVRSLLQTMRWRPPYTTTCHNDLNPWNIIRPIRGDWVTLDWEWAGSNDPLFDLVTLHQCLELEGALAARARSLPALAARYLGSPADPARLESCVIAFWLREYAWAHDQQHAGNHEPQIERQLQTSLARLSGR